MPAILTWSIEYLSVSSLLNSTNMLIIDHISWVVIQNYELFYLNLSLPAFWRESSLFFALYSYKMEADELDGHSSLTVEKETDLNSSLCAAQNAKRDNNAEANEFIRKYRGKDAIKIVFNPKKYGISCGRYARRKEAQLFRTFCSTDLFILDPEFMLTCMKKLDDESMRNAEKDALRRKQDWARRYCIVKRFFAEADERAKFHHVKTIMFTDSRGTALTECEEEDILENFKNLKKDIKDISFHYEIHDKLNNVKNCYDLFDTAKFMLLDGPEFLNLKLIPKDEKEI